MTDTSPDALRALADEYRPVPGFPDLAVTEAGAAKRVDLDRAITPNLTSSGYLRLAWRKEGVRVAIPAHRAVALAFIGPRPSNDHIIAHLDGNRTNNHASNLSWVTYSENEQQKKAHGTCLTGQRNPQAKLNPEVVEEIRRLNLSGLGARKIGLKFGLSDMTVREVIKGKRWGDHTLTGSLPEALRIAAHQVKALSGKQAVFLAADRIEELERALAAEKEAAQVKPVRRFEDTFSAVSVVKEQFSIPAAREARREALEEAAEVAETALVGRYTNGPDIGTARRYIAAAIRALINDTGPSIADELAQARGFIKDYQRQLSEEMVRSSVAEAKLAKVQEALDDLAIRLGDPQRRYDKIGPTWTGKDGHEYSDMSELLDFATEISEQAAAIRALIDREPAPVVADGWQPIETALKDLTPVLLYDGVDVFVGWWGREGFGEKHNWVNWGIDRDGDRVTYQPTHWRPLPTPPEPAP